MLINKEYGYCEYSFEEDEIGKYIHIYNLYIYFKFRRQGKAKILIHAVIDLIRKSGYDGEIQIVAEPQEDSISKEKLKNFYESLGLKVYECYKIL